ncbi:hypothetical protein VTK26DRAFT_4025 [Humicola hyalothermophila]
MAVVVDGDDDDDVDVEDRDDERRGEDDEDDKDDARPPSPSSTCRHVPKGVSELECRKQCRDVDSRQPGPSMPTCR